MLFSLDFYRARLPALEVLHPSRMNVRQILSVPTSGLGYQQRYTTGI